MKRCPKCDIQFSDADVFCSKCATKLEPIPEPGSTKARKSGIDLRKKDTTSEAKPDAPAGDPLLESAQASYQAGRYSDCIRQLEKAMESGIPGARRMYGCFLDDSEAFRQAAERYYYSDRTVQKSPSSSVPSSARIKQALAYFVSSGNRRVATMCSILLILGVGIGGIWWASYHSSENCFKRGKEALRQSRFEDAADTLSQAAEKGHAGAQYLLGLCYIEGAGVVKNEEEAVKWFRKAAMQGHVDAQCLLGQCYEYGKGVKKDAAEAEKWYTLAAKQGSEFAKDRLSLLPSLGRKIGF